MGTGEADGEDRAIKAAELAISNPLLDDTSISNAKGVIINISGGEDVKLYEIDEIAAHIKKQCKEDVNLIVGNTVESIADGKIRVSLLASGINKEMGLEESCNNNEEDAQSFLRPRLVASRNEAKKNNTVKANFNKNNNTTQSDLEDFLSKKDTEEVLQSNKEEKEEKEKEGGKEEIVNGIYILIEWRFVNWSMLIYNIPLIFICFSTCYSIINLFT